MVTVISRPLGHKLTDAELTAEVFDNSGEALFLTTFAHGLVDGDYVYVQSDIETYNGYKYVDSIAYNEFKLRESSSGDFVQFKQQISATYRISVLQHGYLAISQPIVYELESDLWPNNEPEESYTPRVVSSQDNAEGYTQLNLSSALNSPFALDFIELVGTGPLAGVYQILTVLQPWSVIINLQYSASNSFAGYTIVKYYNNYCINVDIYSGLGTEHPWYAEKPYELAATLRFTPDADGRCKFSISDILKGYLETRNNLTLAMLPNNLDFMTAFYIEYYESYDSSDGDEITTFESAVFSDKISFEGHAINADMPFKSLYISHMSEYLNEDTYFAKWLILQSNPVLVVGYFFDLSFINILANRDILILANGELMHRLVNPGIGVLRVPIEPDVSGQLCITAHSDTSTQEIPPEEVNLSEMFNGSTGGVDWTLGEFPVVVIPGVNNSDLLILLKSVLNGQTLKVNYNISLDGGGAPSVGIYFGLSSDTSSLPDQQLVLIAVNGVASGSVSILATVDRQYFAMLAANGGTTPTITINSISFGDPSTVVVPGEQITEEICLTVLEECDSTFIPDDDIRLTEDGDFRILE